MQRLPRLTREFVAENREQAWDTIRLRRNINKLSDYDFTPFNHKGTNLNVYNLSKYLAPLIKNFKIEDNNNYVKHCGFNSPLEASQAFFVFSPEYISKHFIKIKKIIEKNIILLCQDDKTKSKVLHCLVDLNSMKIDYEEEQLQKKKP